MGTRRSRATSSAWCAAARCSTSRRFSPSSTSKASAPRFHPSSEPSKRPRSEEHTSELQSQSNLVCRLLLEKKKLEQQLPVVALLSMLGSVPYLTVDADCLWVCHELKAGVRFTSSSVVPLLRVTLRLLP